MTAGALPTGDVYLDLVKRASMLEALREESLDRSDLDHRLGISRATSHRHTNALIDLGLIDRVDGDFQLTGMGVAIVEAVDSFKSKIKMAYQLGPVLEEVGDSVPPIPLAAFADATVTSANKGDPHAPVYRYIALVRETETLRGFDTWSIAPTYMGEIQQQILKGMETELIDPIGVVEDVMENYPERCVQVCVSGYLTIWLHEMLPFGLAIFDDRIGLGVRDPETSLLHAFIDTDAPAAREWAKAVYETYKADAVRLDDFTKKGLREAMMDD